MRSDIRLDLAVGPDLDVVDAAEYPDRGHSIEGVDALHGEQGAQAWGRIPPHGLGQQCGCPSALDHGVLALPEEALPGNYGAPVSVCSDRDRGPVEVLEEVRDEVAIGVHRDRGSGAHLPDQARDRLVGARHQGGGNR